MRSRAGTLPISLMVCTTLLSVVRMPPFHVSLKEDRSVTGFNVTMSTHGSVGVSCMMFESELLSVVSCIWTLILYLHCSLSVPCLCWTNLRLS